MSLQEHNSKEKWLETRGELCKAWSRLTADELDKTKGEMQAISGLIKQKYSEAKDSYNKDAEDKKLSTILERFEPKKAPAAAGSTEPLKN